MRKQFDLEYYLEHTETKVVTRDGRSARILCTDFKNEQCQIIATYNSDGSEHVSLYHNNGLVVMGVEHNNDLLFDLPDHPKKRVPLTYEDLLQRVKEGKTMWIFASCNICGEIVFFTTDTVDVGDRSTVYEFLKDAEFHFSDGEPCWKEVEDEEKKNERHGGHPWPECQKFCRHYVEGKDSMFCHDCCGSDDWFEEKGVEK